jgi:hypothetical protein
MLVKLFYNKRPMYRWVVRKRDDDRFIVRVPKDGVLISDFGKETLLPKGATIYR